MLSHSPFIVLLKMHGTPSHNLFTVCSIYVLSFLQLFHQAAWRRLKGKKAFFTKTHSFQNEKCIAKITTQVGSCCYLIWRVVLLKALPFLLLLGSGSGAVAGWPAAGQRPVLAAAPEMNAAGESLISVTDSS